jgi:hypothetical protein
VAAVETLTEIVPERCTARLTMNLVDETGAAVPAAQLVSLRMWILAVTLNGVVVVNSQADINILNANQGTVDSGGELILTLTPADNQLAVGLGQVDETHRIELLFTYGAAGAKSGRKAIEFTVANFYKAP